MQTIEAQYEIVTPMFIGGAHQNDEPEIRPPSVKGALRFWWRAQQWGDCLKSNEGNAHLALKALYRDEAKLFGAAARDDAYGQGLFQLRLKQIDPQGTEKKWPKNNDAGAGFLGYGLDATRNGQPHRWAIKQGKFTVCLSLKPAISSDQVQQLQHSLMLFGLLGGLGSRARRGFGSVAITSLNEKTFNFQNSEDYFEILKKQIASIQLAPSMPLITALNDAIQVAKAGEAPDPRRLMDQLGGAYKEARKKAGKGMAKLPFGLPLAGNKGSSDENNRRSSPLLLHIHPIGNQFVAMATLIPAQFHPDYPEGKELGFYRPILDFMNTLERVYP
ncbi:type III-B CRISPR module RAMP protein Cmr1 [Methylomarinum sp. Ch1-1]|uniref:Type III-B CRISPR module RAMP protein Cmr1 n=1 Tax=Methylomarinum roseum TaxID=3067653 RepID=A0AAU7NZJ7_9GAMM